MTMLLLICMISICILPATSFSCPGTCLCSRNPKGFEYVCPKFVEHPDIIQVGENFIEISCDSDGNVEPPKELNVGKKEKFTALYCPVPAKFYEYVHSFGATATSMLSFSYTDFGSTGLSQKLLVGLESLTHLIIESSHLTRLDEDVFKDTSGLIQISLRENDISDLPSGIFSYTPNLEALDLSMNKITTLDKNIFKGLESLEVLSLFKNQLLSLPDDIFEDLVNLTSLELSFNTLSSLPENVFRPLNNLRQLNLDGNDLKTLPGEIFKENFNLHVVRLSGNPGLTLPNGLFANSSVTEIHLTHNKLTFIPESLFSNMTNIQGIWMQNNELQSLPKSLFSNLASLKILHLQSNKLENVDGLFNTLKDLKELIIAKNQISHIEYNTFNDLTNLEKLDFSENKITDLPLLTFISNQNLKYIDAASNELSFKEEEEALPFNYCLGLETLKLHHNRIEVLHTDFIRNKVNLTLVDLSYNRIRTLPVSALADIFQRKTVINLSYNNISSVDFFGAEILAQKNVHEDEDNEKTHVIISNNPINCGCSAYDLMRYKSRLMERQIYTAIEFTMENLQCSSPSTRQGIPLSSLQIQTWTCPLFESCAETCSCEYRPYDTAIVVDCSNRNLSFQPTLQLPDASKIVYNHTEMHLEYNNLTSFTNFNMNNYTNITKLYLSHNRIKNVVWVPPQLNVLKLDNNYITEFHDRFLSTLNATSLIHLTLHNNPWICNCSTMSLTRFLRKKVKQEKHFMIDASNIKCKDTGKALINLNEKDVCRTYTVAVLVYAITATSFLLLVTVAAALFYKYKQEIKVWLFAHKMLMWWVTEEDMDKDKLYDAFICFSHKDDDFVIQELVPVLERQSYKLCMHYRDWMAGELIVKQIVDSVINSKRTIIVLSRNFLDSVWGKVEFRIAHKQSIAEGRARVILILHGDIDTDKDLDDELRAYITTNTYVKWGDPYFWNKLKYALPHSQNHLTCKTPKHQKHANIMKTLEDKFCLNQASPEVCSINLAISKDTSTKTDTSDTNSSSLTQSSEVGLLT